MTRKLHRHEQFRPSNMLARSVLEGDLLARVKEHFEVDKEQVFWDVGIPMDQSGRPVIDRNNIDPTKLTSGRGHLGISTGPSGDHLSITLGNFYRSRYNKEPITVGLPVVGEANGVFGPTDEVQQFESIGLQMDKAGTITMNASDSNGAVVPVYEGSNPIDPDYEHMINFAKRMLIIPFHEGHRQPLVPSVRLELVGSRPGA